MPLQNAGKYALVTSSSATGTANVECQEPFISWCVPRGKKYKTCAGSVSRGRSMKTAVKDEARSEVPTAKRKEEGRRRRGREWIRSGSKIEGRRRVN